MKTLYIVLASLLLFFVLGYSRNKRAKKKVVRIIDNNCTGCRRCIKKCRHKALDTVNDETEQHIAVKYPEKCTACGDCVAACKFNALELVDRKQPE